MDCETSYEMWSKICQTYERDTEQQRCCLLQKFYSATFEKGVDMSTYLSKLKNLAYRLNAINTKIDEKMLISKILATLPKEYVYFVSAWESTEPERKTLENLTARLLGEELRINPKEEEKPVALKATQKKCNKCNKFGHLTKFCRSKPVPKDKSQVCCFKCNKHGHIAKYCKEEENNYNTKRCNICKKDNHFEKDCYFRNKKENKNDVANKVALMASETYNNDIWIMDSGSSSHMTNQKKYFKDLEKIKTVINLAKSEEIMYAYGKGSIEFDKCKLKEVLYVPNLSTNLLSVNSITKNGGEVIFTEDEVLVKAENKTIMKGKKMSNGLFQVKLKVDVNIESLLTEKAESQAKQWHRKLGHASHGIMKKTAFSSEGMKLSNNDLEELKHGCDVCQKAKQTRLSFGDTRMRATRPLQIIHTDLCDPIDPMTGTERNILLHFLMTLLTIH